MSPLRESTARTRELGAGLRQVREDARYTGKELALKLGWSASKVSRMESGDRTANPVEVAIFSAFCGAIGDDLHRLVDLAHRVDDDHWLHARGVSLPDELRSLITLETTAQVLVYYEPIVIPGLIQTEGYARALFDETDLLPKETIESCVRIRMDRQRLLRRRRPPEVTFFIHENALRMPVGDERVMHEQFLHLLLMCAAPPCRLRVVPTSAIGAVGPFTWAAHKEHNPVVYVEHLTTSLFLEERDEVLAYRRLVGQLSNLALDEAQSREFLATLASEHDQVEGAHDSRDRTGPDLA